MPRRVAEAAWFGSGWVRPVCVRSLFGKNAPLATAVQVSRQSASNNTINAKGLFRFHDCPLPITPELLKCTWYVREITITGDHS